MTALRTDRIASAQGWLYVTTGLWPIISLRSFTKVTGPKLEGWLVKTMGGLIAVVGSAFLFSRRRRRVPPETMLLGAGSAAALATADIVYTVKRRISPVYLLDAGAELLLLAGWIQAARPQQPRRRLAPVTPPISDSAW